MPRVYYFCYSSASWPVSTCVLIGWVAGLSCTKVDGGGGNGDSPDDGFGSRQQMTTCDEIWGGTREDVGRRIKMLEYPAAHQSTLWCCHFCAIAASRMADKVVHQPPPHCQQHGPRLRSPSNPPPPLSLTALVNTVLSLSIKVKSKGTIVSCCQRPLLLSPLTPPLWRW